MPGSSSRRGANVKSPTIGWRFVTTASKDLDRLLRERGAPRQAGIHDLPAITITEHDVLPRRLVR
jgi:hypothetical protein